MTNKRVGDAYGVSPTRPPNIKSANKARRGRVRRVPDASPSHNSGNTWREEDALGNATLTLLRSTRPLHLLRGEHSVYFGREWGARCGCIRCRGRDTTRKSSGGAEGGEKVRIRTLPTPPTLRNISTHPLGTRDPLTEVASPGAAGSPNYQTQIRLKPWSI